MRDVLVTEQEEFYYWFLRDEDTPGVDVSFLSVNKQILDESRRIFYSGNSFKLTTGDIYSYYNDPMVVGPGKSLDLSKRYVTLAPSKHFLADHVREMRDIELYMSSSFIMYLLDFQGICEGPHRLSRISVELEVNYQGYDDDHKRRAQIQKRLGPIMSLRGLKFASLRTKGFYHSHLTYSTAWENDNAWLKWLSKQMMKTAEDAETQEPPNLRLPEKKTPAVALDDDGKVMVLEC